MTQQRLDESFEGVAVAAPMEAVVSEVAEGGRVSLRLPEASGAVVEARVAVHGYVPTIGDRVLLTEGARGRYVTGVLLAPPPELRAGVVRARLEDGQLVVRSTDGALLLSIDAVTGAARLAPEQGVLSIECAERLELKAPDVTIEAERLVQRVTDLTTEAVRIGTSADRWDLRANKITERAKNVFRDVEALLQTRAGTLRSIARGGMSLFAERTHIRSKKDTAVDGARVLLG